jgi:outer membrane lipoprotein-sorting protein
MRRLRTLPTSRLVALAAALLVLALGAGIAQAALGGDPKPAPKPLDQALLDAARAPQPAGITARIAFTDGLLPSGAVPGGSGSPLLTGAKGRLWLAADGRARLELQSDRGDTSVVADGRSLSVYDAASNTLYRMPLPTGGKDSGKERPATLAGIRRALAHLSQAWALTGAQPTSTAGRPTYTVRIAPKDDGGLLGAGEVAWDAARGIPLRAAIYAQGAKNPVLELKATDVAYGAIDPATLRLAVPAGAKRVTVEPPAAGAHAGTGHGAANSVTGVQAVQRRLGFQLSAPDRLAGLPRRTVRLVRFGADAGAATFYGKGLGGILVLQRAASPASGSARGHDMRLPQINIDGVTGTELATALGTVVSFQRGGVQYTVLGSVPPVAAENAARGLR